MRTAIYARRSTDEHQQASLDVQVSEAKRFIAAKGWTLDEAHIFVDDGISRTEFVKRAGLIRLLLAAEEHAFDIVVTRDETRIGGDTNRTCILIQQILDAGVALHYYFADDRVTLSDAMGKFLVSVRSFASELETEKLRQRTRETLMTKARSGQNAGGRCYGYDNVEVRSGDRRAHVEYRVNAEQAEIVREIFRRFVAGDGLRTIGKDLNERGVPAPRADRGRNRTWAPSCVREMLTRERYRGVLVWGKTAKVYRAGTTVRVAGDPAKMTRIELPDLRIVDDALWNTVAAQMAANVKLSGRQGGAAGPPARFLLSGLARCGLCGGRMEAVNGKVGSQVVRVYICG